MREEERLGREKVFDIREDAAPVRAIPTVPQSAPAPERPAAPVPAPAAKSAPAAEETASGADTAIWEQLIDHYKGRLAVNHRVFLNMAAGALEDDCLTVYCNNDFVRTSLDHPSVISVLQEVTASAVGHPIRVVMTVGKAPQGGAAPRRRAPVRPTPAPVAAPAPAPAPAAPAPVAEKAPVPVEAPAPQSPPPAETPPWEEPPAGKKDMMDEIVASAKKLEHFNIK